MLDKEIWSVVGEMLGRHGTQFKDSHLKFYLKNKDWRRAGEYFFFKKDYDKAIQYFNEEIKNEREKNHPNNIWISLCYYYIAQCIYQSGEYKKAVNFLLDSAKKVGKGTWSEEFMTTALKITLKHKNIDLSFEAAKKFNYFGHKVCQTFFLFADYPEFLKKILNIIPLEELENFIDASKYYGEKKIALQALVIFVKRYCADASRLEDKLKKYRYVIDLAIEIKDFEIALNYCQIALKDSEGIDDDICQKAGWIHFYHDYIIKIYKEKGDYLKAAKICTDFINNNQEDLLGRNCYFMEMAVELYETAGAKMEAVKSKVLLADYFVKYDEINKMDDVKRLYVEASKFYEENGDLKKAAELYEKVNMPEKAAEIYAEIARESNATQPEIEENKNEIKKEKRIGYSKEEIEVKLDKLDDLLIEGEISEKKHSELTKRWREKLKGFDGSN